MDKFKAIEELDQSYMQYSSKRIGFDGGASRHSNICTRIFYLFHDKLFVSSILWHHICLLILSPFHWKIRPLHAFFVCLFLLCLSREITQPPLRRPVSSVGSVSKDVLTMMTDRDKSRAAQNKMRRHWVPRGICTNHVFLGRLTAALK